MADTLLGRATGGRRALAWLAVLLSLLGVAAAGCARGRDLPEMDLAFEKYTLANGLQVILRRDPRVPVVAIDMRYRVGSGDDGPGRTGFAHLFEHMMFQGSGHVRKGEFDDRLAAVGATGVNGATDEDSTRYTETVPANALELALWRRATGWASCSTCSTRRTWPTSSGWCATSAGR